MVNNDLHFKESNLIFLKLILFLSISITLLALDKDLSTSNKIRFNISYLIEPFYKLAELPINIYDNFLVKIIVSSILCGIGLFIIFSSIYDYL